jgi:hypothetical protein
MAVRMRVHSVGGSGVPEIQSLLYTGTSIVLGSLLKWSSGSVDVADTNEDEIVGLALQAYATAPGYDAANSPATITGREAKISVVRPNQQTTFLATLTTGSSATTVPAQANVGVQYGITAYSGIWTIDVAKTGADARVEVVGFDTTLYGGVVFFKFLAAYLSGQ